MRHAMVANKTYMIDIDPNKVIMKDLEVKKITDAAPTNAIIEALIAVDIILLFVSYQTKVSELRNMLHTPGGATSFSLSIHFSI